MAKNKRQRTVDAATIIEAELERDPELRAECDKLGPRFAAIRALIHARERKGLTKAGLAELMGVKPSVVSHLESARHSPRIDTLAEAALAMGYELDVRFKRRARPQGIRRS